MSTIRTIDLTRRESQIMDTLHRRQGATVEELRAELPDAPSPSSVRKLLEIMIERGLVRREYDGPRFVYFPTASPEAASRSALKHLVRTILNSRLYQLSSTPNEFNLADTRHFSRSLRRRLPAEVMLDAVMPTRSLVFTRRTLFENVRLIGKIGTTF